MPEYRLLSQAQIEHLHGATLELLETVGVEIRHPEARHMMADAGCRLGDGERVYFPAGLVEDAIRSAPSRIILYSRSGEEAMRLEGRRFHFGMGTDLARTYDLTTGRLRESTLNDVNTAVHIADALPGIDFIASYAIPNDSPSNLMYFDAFKAQLENSSKPIFFTAAGLEDIGLIRKMAAAAAGGDDVLRQKPSLIHYSEPLSPLIHSHGAVDKLLFCADHHIPVTYAPGMMSGATAPVTLAGALAMGNAEALSGLTLHQVRSKGAPIISGIGMATMDMARATCIYGCPEYRLALSACADLYHHYRIPMWGTAGVTDANCLDQQAGMEWGVSLMINALAGANLIHDIGYMGQGLIGHPAALVMCDEIISYVKRFMRGFKMDEFHLDLEEIQRLGPGGNFLASRHTARMFKKEHWYPDSMNRDNTETWTGSGRKEWGEKAIERAHDILATHQPSPLENGVRHRLDEIRERALVELKGVQFVT